MSIDFIFERVFVAYLYFAAILGCYYGAIFNVKAFIEKYGSPLGYWRKVIICIGAIILILFIAWIYSWHLYTKDKLSGFIAAFIVMLLPLFLGLYQGFWIDKKNKK